MSRNQKSPHPATSVAASASQTQRPLLAHQRLLPSHLFQAQAPRLVAEHCVHCGPPRYDLAAARRR